MTRDTSTILQLTDLESELLQQIDAGCIPAASFANRSDDQVRRIAFKRLLVDGLIYLDAWDFRVSASGQAALERRKRI